LTLNCKGQLEDFRHFTSGEKAHVNPGGITFPATGLLIDSTTASPWQAPDLPVDVLAPAQRRAKLRLVARLVHDRQPASPLAGLLPALTDFEPPPSASHALSSQVEGIQDTLTQRQLNGIVSGLAGLLGLGGGLTPSGDDLATGFLLALRRWGHLLAPGLLAAEIAHNLLPLAYQKTTTLSANLLECAAQGQADERLLLALDGMLSTDPDPPACAAALTAWGHTSGHDALVGMALVILNPGQSS